MNSVNTIILLGHLTHNPRVTHTSSGKTVCDFGLALTRRWLDLNGDRQQETTFVDVTAWNQQAEMIGAYCQKGRPIAVEGRSAGRPRSASGARGSRWSPTASRSCPAPAGPPRRRSRCRTGRRRY